MRIFLIIFVVSFCTVINLYSGYWRYNNEFVGSSYYNIAVKDSNTFYVIGNSQVRARCEYTEDGGKSWINLIPDALAFKDPVNKTGKLVAKTISFFKEKDFEVILIGCGSDTIIRSIDNGKNWQICNLKAQKKAINYIKRLKENIYYSVTDFTFNISEDYGVTWKNIPIPVDSKKHELIKNAYLINDSLYFITVYKVYFNSPTTYIYSDYTYVSNNQGKNWEEYKIEKDVKYRNLTNKIFQVGESNQLFSFLTLEDTIDSKFSTHFYKSYDNGKNWEFIDTTFLMSNNIYINFKNELCGYIVKYAFEILLTNDGGLTWSKESLQYTIPEVRDIAFLNDHKSLLLTTDKLFIKDDRITSIVDITPSSLEIFPNPAGDYITVTLGTINPKVNLGVDETFIQIYNTLGEKVLSVGTGRDLSVQINISDLPKGVYFVKVGGETAKFVKM